MNDFDSRTSTRRWIIFLVMVPLSAVVVGVLMIVAVSQFPDDPVSDDYYKEGLAFNERRDNRISLVIQGIERDHRFGLQARLYPPMQGMYTLGLRHVTDSRKDFDLEIVVGDDGVFSIDDGDLNDIVSKPGVWYLQLFSLKGDTLLNQRVEMPIRAGMGK